MGSAAHRLYDSIAFDKLHVIEHGILGKIPDEAYQVFEFAKAYQGWAKAEVVEIENQRLLDAPRSAQLPAFQPFRRGPAEKMAGVTGKMRRLFSLPVIYRDGHRSWHNSGRKIICPAPSRG